MTYKSPRRVRSNLSIRVDGNNPRWEKDFIAWPTAGALRVALQDAPDDAYVRVYTHNWFWPRWSWTIRAWWGHETRED